MRTAGGFMAVGWALLAAAGIGCRDESSRELAEVLSAAGPAATAAAEDVPSTSPASEPAVPVRPRPGARLLAFDRGWVEWRHQPGEGVTEIRFLSPSGGLLGGIQGVELWLAGPDGPYPVALSAGTGEGAIRPAEPIADPLPQGVLRFTLGREMYRVALPLAAASQPSASVTPDGA